MPHGARATRTHLDPHADTFLLKNSIYANLCACGAHPLFTTYIGTLPYPPRGCFTDSNNRVTHTTKQQKKKHRRVGGPPGGFPLHSHRTSGGSPSSPCSQWSAGGPHWPTKMRAAVPVAAAILPVAVAPRDTPGAWRIMGFQGRRHPCHRRAIRHQFRPTLAYPRYPGAIFAPRRRQVGQARPTARLDRSDRLKGGTTARESALVSSGTCIHSIPPPNHRPLAFSQSANLTSISVLVFPSTPWTAWLAWAGPT